MHNRLALKLLMDWDHCQRSYIQWINIDPGNIFDLLQHRTTSTMFHLPKLSRWQLFHTQKKPVTSKEIHSVPLTCRELSKADSYIRVCNQPHRQPLKVRDVREQKNKQKIALLFLSNISPGNKQCFHPSHVAHLYSLLSTSGSSENLFRSQCALCPLLLRSVTSGVWYLQSPSSPSGLTA